MSKIIPGNVGFDGPPTPLEQKQNMAKLIELTPSTNPSARLFAKVKRPNSSTVNHLLNRNKKAIGISRNPRLKYVR